MEKSQRNEGANSRMVATKGIFLCCWKIFLFFFVNCLNNTFLNSILERCTGNQLSWNIWRCYSTEIIQRRNRMGREERKKCTFI